ncbi:MAG TPA: ribulose-phosphate 3-epimerase [Egibacteraceae bacterium]|jgi:ribulose-phosphate 3-epimerase|nr:ribulose-phosphate 3-epimerase [Egibacteraceae bacterium]
MSAKIVPAMLPVDFTRLGEDCIALEKAGADRFQWDVMDGQFVPNITYGPDLIAACRPLVDVGFEAHVMCRDPEWMVPKLVDAGCDIIIVHVEAMKQPHATYQSIRQAGARAGIALSPATPVSYIEHVLDLVDLVLVMTVNPGFGGQAYISTMEPKIAEARALIDASGHDVELEVDGGISADTIAGAAKAGANVFTSGSALWKYDSFAEGVKDLRARAEAALDG